MAFVKILSLVNGRPKGHVDTSDSLKLAGLQLQGLAGGVTHILDEDNLVSNSAAAIATQQSIKAYVDAAVLTVNELGECTDVTLASVAQAEMLVYDADSTKWENQIMSGDVTMSKDGVTTIGANTVALSTDTTGNYVQQGGVSGVGLSGSVNSEGGTFTVASNATNVAGNSTIVARDGSGNFAAGTITANLTGNASGTAATVTGAAQTAITSVGLLTALQVDNINLNGNAIASNHASAMTLTANTGQAVAVEGVSFDGGVVTGASSITSTALAGELTGNASTATVLATARTIAGQSFNGSAAITIAAADLSDVTAVGSGSIISAAERTLLTATPGTATASKALVVDGNMDLTLGGGDFTATDITALGNLVVSGTTTTVSSTVVSVADPLMEVGTSGADDNKDRGMVMKYHNGSAPKLAFMGWDDSVSKFTMIPDASNTGEVIGGAAGILVADLEGDVTGNVTGNASGTAATVTAGTQSSITACSNLVTVGVIGTGTWEGTAVAAAHVGALPTGQITSGVFADARIAVGNVTQHQASLTATGALGAGSIASGFGAINNGSSGITSTGTIAMTTLSDGVATVLAADVVGGNSVQHITAGEDVKAGEPVSMGSGGTLFVADLSETDIAAGSYDAVIGVAANTADSGASVVVLCGVGTKCTKPGALGNFDIGKPVFLNTHGAADGSTAYTQTPPATDDHAVVLMGVAVSTSEFIFSGAKVGLVN